MKQKLTEPKGEIDKIPIRLGDFSSLLLVLHRTSKWKSEWTYKILTLSRT